MAPWTRAQLSRSLGTVTRGTQLPHDVSPTPIPGRPGYGAAIVNGHRAIVDLNTNTVFQYSR